MDFIKLYRLILCFINLSLMYGTLWKQLHPPQLLIPLHPLCRCPFPLLNWNILKSTPPPVLWWWCLTSPFCCTRLIGCPKSAAQAPLLTLRRWSSWCRSSQLRRTHTQSRCCARPTPPNSWMYKMGRIACCIALSTASSLWSECSPVGSSSTHKSAIKPSDS